VSLTPLSLSFFFCTLTPLTNEEGTCREMVHQYSLLHSSVCVCVCECEGERKVVIEFACRKEREREFYMTISEEMKSHRKRVCVRACLPAWEGKGSERQTW